MSSGGTRGRLRGAAAGIGTFTLGLSALSAVPLPAVTSPAVAATAAQGIVFCAGDGTYRTCRGDCLSAKCFEDERKAKAAREGIAGERKTKSVFFNSPPTLPGEKGFSGAVTFDIEYQLIACMGELHVAYSLVENSVRQRTPNYFYEGRYWQVKSPMPQIISLPLKGFVTDPPMKEIGRFGDDAAGKALGFGCFSGQSKKVADLKDYFEPNPPKEKVAAFLDRLLVSFTTPQILKSAAAENEIKPFLAPPPEVVAQRRSAAQDAVRALEAE